MGIETLKEAFSFQPSAIGKKQKGA